ncbi:P-type conjugative transfer protein TrbG [Roseibium aggregatum]|uniref:P-type conjugative transfer protein TrbG n=1 Tax=Roseibium aggregatum TaxID=187304 RepID=A0A939ELE1_9HYPH|nr:P-type conjugative transfer protein TrbG [Roseibium aggregatum]MBN9673705.1 P-type conjugative transfer protein TrbG [Roseibium aggregatum]
MKTAFRKSAFPAFRIFASAAVLLCATALAGCATYKPTQISYDANVPPLPAVLRTVGDERPKPLHTPPVWTPTKGGKAAKTSAGRIENANAAARVEPRREGYYNAIQIYPWSEGALYQVYTAPGKITDIALEPGEALTGAGPIAAGDTARWIIGDTTSGSGEEPQVHILVKPTRPDIETNLVVTTDRRVYRIELRAAEGSYMPAVAWNYPRLPGSQRSAVTATPRIPSLAARNYRYGLTGDTPPWRPVAVYDDGRRVYVEFPGGIAQGEMPPVFVLGPEGKPEIVNSRVYRNILIVDRIFGAAELRLGSGKHQQTVRIVRTDGKHNDLTKGQAAGDHSERPTIGDGGEGA